MLLVDENGSLIYRIQELLHQTSRLVSPSAPLTAIIIAVGDLQIWGTLEQEVRVALLRNNGSEQTHNKTRAVKSEMI